MNRVEPYQIDEEHRSTDALEDDIQSTRERMDKTLDKLSSKLSPERYIEGAGDWMKDKIDRVDTGSLKESATGVGKATGDFIRNHPVPVALGALTIASIFAKKSKTYDRKIEDPYIPAHPNADGPTGKLDPTLGDGVNQLPENSDNVTSNGTLSRAADSVKSGISSAAHTTGNKLSQGKEEYPVAMALGAMALGFLAALTLPRTRKENEICGETADEFRHDVADRGRQIVDETKSTLHEKKDELVSKARAKVDEAVEETKDTVDQKIDETAEAIEKKVEKAEPS